MRDGAFPAMLLSLMLGLTLAFAARRTVAIACLLLAAAALATSLFALPLEWRGAMAIGCWSETVLLAILVFSGRPLPAPLAAVAATIAGCFVGAVASQLARPFVIVEALLCTLILLPAAWLVRRRWSIAVKVLASWLLAVAVLAGGTTIATGPTAGSDHLD